MEEKMKVWVAEYCPAYEQGSVIGVFSSREKALAARDKELEVIGGITTEGDYCVSEYTIDE